MDDWILEEIVASIGPGSIEAEAEAGRRWREEWRGEAERATASLEKKLGEAEETLLELEEEEKEAEVAQAAIRRRWGGREEARREREEVMERHFATNFHRFWDELEENDPAMIEEQMGEMIILLR